MRKNLDNSFTGEHVSRFSLPHIFTY